MLWACELKPSSWWTDDLNLVRICVELLQTLSVWLTDTRCPHYFINNYNLLDNSFNVASVARKLMSIDEEYLSTWFINSYVGQCAHLCPVHISRSFNDISTVVKLQNVVSEIIGWRLNTSFDDLWWTVSFAEILIATTIVPHTVRSFVCLMKQFAEIDQRLCSYFSAVTLLHVARIISRNSFNNDLRDILAILLGRNVNRRTNANVFSVGVTEMNTSELAELLVGSYGALP